MSHFTAGERDEVRARLVALFAADDRVEGVLAVGSGAEGYRDRRSDVDLAVVLRDDVSPREFATSSEPPLPSLARFGDDRGEAGYVVGLLLERFLEVDIGFLRVGQMAASGMALAVLFDRTGAVERRQRTLEPAPLDLTAEYRRHADHIWHWLMRGAAAIERGEPLLALTFLDEVRARTLALAALEHGLASRKDYDRLPADVRQRVERSLPRSLAREELGRALRAAAAAFFAEVRELDARLALDHAARLAPVVTAYFDELELPPQSGCETIPPAKNTEEEPEMKGLIMDYELNVSAILRRAETLFGRKSIVTRLPDRSFHTYTYGDFAARAKRLASALQRLGLTDGARVATLCWNHYQHLETYFGVPMSGNVVHTLNLRLHPSDLAYIANHAGDRVLVVDDSLLPLYQAFKDQAPFEHVVVIGDAPEGTIPYEQLIADGDPAFEPPEMDERDAAVMCYTSGTTGQPKGVLYSHRAIALHSLASAQSGTLGISEGDVVLPVVPMFHANAWGFPFTCTLVGATQIFPGPYLDPESLLDAFEQQRVTLTGGVPTIWLGILQMLDKEPERWDLSSLRAMIVGGSAAPRAMIEGFQQRHGLHVIHAWGMTEMTPLGTVAGLTADLRQAPEDEQYRYRAKQGTPAPFVEIRARGVDGLVPWDGQTMGELEVRGVWIASRYYEDDSQADRWTDDGWFKTGDIVTIDERGFIEIQDRTKDVIKSGGEWVSSVALENAIMGHPAVAEAAVIAVPDEKWQERPLAVVVLRDGQTASDDALRDFIAPHFAKWQLPDRFEFVDEIPKTAVGKFRKTALREQFAGQTVSAS